MSVRKTQQVAEDYATEDALFAQTLSYIVDQPIPNNWRRTARLSVISRIKKALGFSTTSRPRHFPARSRSSMDSISITRWGV